MLSHDAMKSILRVMFQGWMIREETWDGDRYTKTAEEAMIEAAGDENVGYLIHLFDYWCNDIQDMAPRFGLKLDRDQDGKLVIRECEIDTSPLYVDPIIVQVNA
jgi:hypothetical protein